MNLSFHKKNLQTYSNFNKFASALAAVLLRSLQCQHKSNIQNTMHNYLLPSALTFTLIIAQIRADSRLYYCGYDWFDANGSCGVPCPGGSNTECPSGQSCFADCVNCCPSAGGYGGKMYNYCGTSWNNANSACGVSCPGGQDSECPAGQSCFAECFNCPQSCLGNYNYCGSTWSNANSVCGVSCEDGTGCPAGQSCFADCYDCPVLSTPLTPTAPTPTPPTSGSHADSRLIAYLGNWQPCPSLAQVSMYTHIKIAFAVSYTWYSTGVVCSPTCDISTPPVCDNAANPGLIQTWQSMGKKVSVSFGGATMVRSMIIMRWG